MVKEEETITHILWCIHLIFYWYVYVMNIHLLRPKCVLQCNDLLFFLTRKWAYIDNHITFFVMLILLLLQYSSQRPLSRKKPIRIDINYIVTVSPLCISL